MRTDVKANTDPELLDDAVTKLRQQFDAVQSFEPSLLPDDAPTQHDVSIERVLTACREQA